MKAQLLICSEGPRKGKTVFAMGLLCALRRKGLKAQPFKCGPNCVDAQLHDLASGGAHSVNLDAWLMKPNEIRELYNSYSEEADVTVVEGDKGLFDGYDRMKGSSADISRTLRIPVVLLVDAKRASYTMAAMIYGMTAYRKWVRFIGVVFNQVASEGQYAFLKQTCRDAGVQCLGYVPEFPDLALPTAGRGLLSQNRLSFRELSRQIALSIEKTVDIDRILGLALGLFPCQYSLPYNSSECEMPQSPKPRLAVANDAPFFFTFRDTMDHLERTTKIVGFSAMHSKILPEADIYYFPGGCIELYARQFYRNKSMLSDIRELAEGGARMLVEGGSAGIFSRLMTSDSKNAEYAMAGVLETRCEVDHEHKPSGYRSVVYNGMTFLGYESTPVVCKRLDDSSVSGIAEYRVSDMHGARAATSFFRYKNVIASTASWRWHAASLLRLWD